ncbi:hypothetical protein [Sphingomonas sp.]|uniref:hypothetical protein n=1 Tax=Sphingomonas sp. TaxID=28214 RepID=UPI002E13DF29|nr:hypothetical protein [Sphingomonas sp.]
MSRVLLALPLLALATACAGPERTAAPAPLPVPAPAPAPTAAPRAPDGAAANLTIPTRLPDGSYATPNRSISAAAAAWHLRAAFNVAALNCNDPALAPAYNQFLKAHRSALKAAHHALTREYGDASAFDPAMTRLYNYFAQPPVMAQFCATAAPLLHQVAALPAGELPAIAPAALAQIDRPFTDFYARYDAWRADLAAWRAGDVPATPRLAYATEVFRAEPHVGGGTVTLAAR